MRPLRLFFASCAIALGACSVVYGDKLSRLDGETDTLADASGDGLAGDGAPADADANGDAPCDACEPETIASALALPGALAVDDANVYWVEEGFTPFRVRACAVTGCAAPVELGTGASTGLATDGAFVYFSDLPTGALLKCPVTGCAGPPTTIASAQDQIEGPVFDGATLAWSTSASGGAIRACAPSACAAPATLATNQGQGLVWLAADAQIVAWTTDTEARSCAVSGCGGAPRALAPSTRVPIALGGGAAAWPRADGTVVACDVASCAPSPVGKTSAPTSLATDGANVYWYDDQLGAIYRCARGGCAGAPAVLASGVKQSRDGAGMVLRGAWLYFATDHAIRRVRR